MWDFSIGQIFYQTGFGGWVGAHPLVLLRGGLFATGKPAETADRVDHGPANDEGNSFIDADDYVGGAVENKHYDTIGDFDCVPKELDGKSEDYCANEDGDYD